MTPLFFVKPQTWPKSNFSLCRRLDTPYGRLHRDDDDDDDPMIMIMMLY